MADVGPMPLRALAYAWQLDDRGMSSYEKGVVQGARAGAGSMEQPDWLFQGDVHREHDRPRCSREPGTISRVRRSRPNLTSALSNLGHVLMNQGGFRALHKQPTTRPWGSIESWETSEVRPYR